MKLLSLCGKCEKCAVVLMEKDRFPRREILCRASQVAILLQSKDLETETLLCSLFKEGQPKWGTLPDAETVSAKVPPWIRPSPQTWPF